ncbi:Uma2 family endonuclease [Natronospora cellulosivora (SeqCode)]
MCKNRDLKNVTKVKESKREYKNLQKREYTYQDYLKLPEEPGYRYEVLKGKLIKEPSPSVMHQRVSRRLQRLLEDYFWEHNPEGEVFNAPLDVTFNDITVVQPDIFFVPEIKNNIIKEKRIDGSPFLVVEIISPYNPRKDRVQKLQIYQEDQVDHYWLVNPQDKTFECFALRDNVYALISTGMKSDIIEHPDFEGLRISLEELWYQGSDMNAK